MKKKNIIPAVLAAGLVLSASVGSAWAYFTTYVEAQGGYTLSLGDETTIRENFGSWRKSLLVTSDEGSEPVYVRARAFSGELYPVAYSDMDQGKYPVKYDDKDYPYNEGGVWTPNADGYYYYSNILYGGGHTNVLEVTIQDVPEDVTEKEFNVVVIYETTPVQYREDGTPYGPEEIDWDAAKLEVTEGGAE